MSTAKAALYTSWACAIAAAATADASQPLAGALFLIAGVSLGGSVVGGVLSHYLDRERVSERALRTGLYVVAAGFAALGASLLLS